MCVCTRLLTILQAWLKVHYKCILHFKGLQWEFNKPFDWEISLNGVRQRANLTVGRFCHSVDCRWARPNRSSLPGVCVYLCGESTNEWTAEQPNRTEMRISVRCYVLDSFYLLTYVTKSIIIYYKHFSTVSKEVSMKLTGWMYAEHNVLDGNNGK